ncbi:MAG TPA: hypothetical protein DCS09_13315 [Porphyromonadaceae bacterium]|nr:hypothetical protein [Porphyromonadaceae bacterium]
MIRFNNECPTCGKPTHGEEMCTDCGYKEMSREDLIEIVEKSRKHMKLDMPGDNRRYFVERFVGVVKANAVRAEVATDFIEVLGRLNSKEVVG